MMSTNRLLSRWLPVGVAFVVLLSGCTVQEQRMPGLAGPSELGLGMSITATPEFLPRDGSSMSTITARTFDSNGKPIAGQRLKIEASAGTVSVSEVTTGNDGAAQFQYIAPGQNENVSLVAVFATPIQNTHYANSNARIVEILLTGPDIPVASFNLTPASPARFQSVTFDASTSFLGGAACGSACSYSWDFGDGSSGTGRIITRAFQNEGTHVVTLTVTSPVGTFRSTSRTVTVTAAVAPTANFTFSPTNPQIGDQVFFDGSTSRGANGSTIVSYEWNFGNNTFGTGVRPAAVVYGADRSYNVTLTVTDDRGQTATRTQTVAVEMP